MDGRARTHPIIHTEFIQRQHITLEHVQRGSNRVLYNALPSYRRCHDSSWILLDYFSLNISIDTIKMPDVIRNEMFVSFVRSMLSLVPLVRAATFCAATRYNGPSPYGRMGETKA